jgi:hypothetical protein
MSSEELLNRKRLADPALTSQTQSREEVHARVSLERFEKAGVYQALPLPERRTAGRSSVEVLYSSGSVVNCSG